MIIICYKKLVISYERVGKLFPWVFILLFDQIVTFTDEVAGFINMESVIEVRKEPLSVNPSPFVYDSAASTLNIIDKGQYIFSSELPQACKVDTFFNPLLKKKSIK